MPTISRELFIRYSLAFEEKAGLLIDLKNLPNADLEYTTPGQPS